MEVIIKGSTKEIVDFLDSLQIKNVKLNPAADIYNHYGYCINYIPKKYVPDGAPRDCLLCRKVNTCDFSAKRIITQRRK